LELAYHALDKEKSFVILQLNLTNPIEELGINCDDKLIIKTNSKEEGILLKLIF
jgi:hypothetical protein